MAQGKSTRAMAEELGVSHWDFFEWIHETPQREQRYARAMEARAQWWANEIERVCEEPVRRNEKGNLDPADVQMKRLKVDTLKWVAAKFAPKRFGDRVEVDATVKHDVVGELRAFLGASGRLPVADQPGVLDAPDLVRVVPAEPQRAERADG